MCKNRQEPPGQEVSLRPGLMVFFSDFIYVKLYITKRFGQGKSTSIQKKDSICNFSFTKSQPLAHTGQMLAFCMKLRKFIPRGKS
jgi:hypothetical protein